MTRSAAAATASPAPSASARACTRSTFNKNVSKCAYTANVGNPGDGNPAALTISTASRSGNKNGVFVLRAEHGGRQHRCVVYLDVACGKQALDAVVDTAGPS